VHTMPDLMLTEEAFPTGPAAAVEVADEIVEEIEAGEAVEVEPVLEAELEPELEGEPEPELELEAAVEVEVEVELEAEVVAEEELGEVSAEGGADESFAEQETQPDEAEQAES